MNVSSIAKDAAMFAAMFAALVLVNRLLIKPNVPSVAAYLPGGQ